jgi:dsRNA-specific ribonuclease
VPAGSIHIPRARCLMDPDELASRCEAILAYRFHDHDLLREALTHASIADDRRLSNERLEFLGDSVLGLVVCHRLYDLFPDYLEGDLTKLKSAVVSRNTCAAVANAIGLTDLIFVGKGMMGRRPGATARHLRAAARTCRRRWRRGCSSPSSRRFTLMGDLKRRDVSS